MKKIIIIWVTALLMQFVIQAQGVVYLSNLDESSSGSAAVGSNSWLAADFITGNYPGGYLLNSIQLGLTNATGNPSGITVMVYTDVGITGELVGNSLGNLIGSSNPETGGIYTYADDSNIILSPHTDYFIVLTAGTAISDGAYEWNLSGIESYNRVGGWFESDIKSSNDGLSWGSLSAIFPQYAITATPVPEPSAFGLFGLGGLLLLGTFFRHKAHQSP